jgi:tetratricopeptide (TPR) repeat protein
VLGETVAAGRIAEAEIRLARTAIYNGELQDAEAHLASASAAIPKNPLAAQVTPLLLIVRGQLFLVAGDFAQAESLFSDAHNQAEAHQEPLWAAEAILHIAQTYLARGALDAAQTTFLEAGREFQTLESTGGDGSAVLGVAQVNLGQQRWDEAIENCDAAILRLTQAGDLLGQADALLTRGLAHRGKDELDEALQDYEQALKLYHQERRPLGVADTRSARAGIFFLRGDLERARDEQAKAITQVEHVMQTLKTPQLWSSFLRQYADLYAQTAVTDLRRNRDDEARTLLQNFARIAGTAELAQQLKMYEDNLPTSSEDLSEEEIRANKDLAKRIAQIRRGL